MTRKAHNVDTCRTVAAGFLDPRSYITHKGHEYLFEADVSKRRQEIYDRDKGICQIKGPKCEGYVPGWHGELHHIKGGNTDDRCWCPHNLQWACRTCHRAQHVQVKFGQQKVSV